MTEEPNEPVAITGESQATTPSPSRTKTWLIAGGAALAVIAIVTIAAVATDGSNVAPSVSPSASAEPSAIPSPSPSTPASTTPLYSGRNPLMTDQEAIARAENPATGEVWLASPQEIPEPAWAADGSFGTLNGPTWYEVGHRGGNTIISQDRSGYLVEVSPDGTPTLVIAPYPYEPGLVDNSIDYSITVDPTIYYDSLAVPATATTPDGTIVDIRGNRFGRDDLGGASVETLARYGGNQWAMLTRASATYAIEAPRVKAITEASSVDVGWAIITPYGAIFQPEFDPAAQPITWNDGYGPRTWDDEYGTYAPRGFVDFYDYYCGNDTELNVQVPAGSFGPWVEVGQSPAGPILAPTADSPLAQAAYQDLFDLVTGTDGAGNNPFLVSLESFVAQPGIIAIPMADGTGWWLMVNQDASTRVGC